MTARIATAIAVLALALMASAGPGEAASDQPGRQFRAALHDFFAPPRRSKRPKAKQERAAKPEQGSGRPANAAVAREKAIEAAMDASSAAREVKPVARPARAKDSPRPEREARLPATKDVPAAKETAKEPAPAPRDALPAKPHGRPAQSAAPPAPAPAVPTATPPASTLPAKPHGRPAKTAALPPAAEPAGKDTPADTAEPETPPSPSACQLRLTDELAAIQVMPPIKTEQCAVDDVVRLDAVVAKDGRRVAMSPPATLRCTMAEAVVHWVRDELAPTEFGAPLKSLSIDTSFECRSRNRIKGAKLSEHGNANAIDVRNITLTNGKVLTLTDMAVDKALRERIKAGACARFTTVLGPGSDGYHENHVHLDFIQRRGGYRMCQWDVRDVADVRPMPRERPAEAPPRTASTEKPKARN
jgi:hypothetical protein